MFNAIENVTDSMLQNNSAADDDNNRKMIENEGCENLSSIATPSGKYSKRQISRELFVVNQDGNSNQCNDNNNRGGSNSEHNKGKAQIHSTASGKSGNRRKFFPDSSALSFGDVESPHFITGSSTPTLPSKLNRSIDEMSTPNSSFLLNNTTRSSLGMNSSRKSFDHSGSKNNSISRRNTSSPLCLGDFINTSGASSGGKHGTTAGGECLN